MSIKVLKKIFLGIVGLLFLFVFISAGLAETWNQRYIESLPDSVFAVVEITQDGKKIRHLPHHNHVGEIDIPHLESALGRIHQVKWIDPVNFAKAKTHLDQHYQIYKQERAKARGFKSPIIGCESCVETCPEVFEMSGDKAIVKVDKVPEDVAQSCREAAENCPVEAIQIEE